MLPLLSGCFLVLICFYFSSFFYIFFSLLSFSLKFHVRPFFNSFLFLDRWKKVLFSLSCSSILNYRVEFLYNTFFFQVFVISKKPNDRERTKKKHKNKTHVICIFLLFSWAFFVEFREITKKNGMNKG